GGRRDAPPIAPRNTYPASKQAAAQAAAYTETDIRQTADGGLVLLHDPTLDRTSNGRGPVSSITLAEVRALDAGRWFGDEFEGQRIPELPAFLSWIEVRPGFGAALEVKAPGLGGAVAQLAWASPARDRLAIY